MRIGILGASGQVGRVMLDLLERQSWANRPPLLLTSKRSSGHKLAFRGQDLDCREVSSSAFSGLDVALFSAGAEASRRWAPMAVDAGVWVVDNSSAWRERRDVPLVVPEINGGLVPRLARDRSSDVTTHDGGIIANPNCSTTQIAMPCAALERAAGLREVHVTTMQAVSGAGRRGVDELRDQLSAGADGAIADAGRPGAVFPRRITANTIPEIGAMGEDGFFEEERKVHRELRKILERDDLSVTCTATRVPVWNGHAAAVRAVLDRPLERSEAVEVLDAFEGVACHTDPGGYRTPAEICGETLVHVGRLRHEPGRRDVFLFWVVADNLLKGAAWNAVQIAALLCGGPAR
jgi:aspartate-semialdehyde dehydrogenase